MAKFEKSITISNKLGLHARAATKLAQLCNQYQSAVTVTLEGKDADASSIMALMLLAGSQGKIVQVTTEGSDAEDALSNICKLFTDKFEEEE